MNRPHFTPEQEDFICFMIGKWYLLWKERLVNDCQDCQKKPLHLLGIAKEQLKILICGEDDMRERANKNNFTVEIKVRPYADCDDIYYLDKKTNEVVGYGYLPKGRAIEHICLTRCPACRGENYYANVQEGVCTWCPFNANGENA